MKLRVAAEGLKRLTTVKFEDRKHDPELKTYVSHTGKQREIDKQRAEGLRLMLS